MSEVDATDVDLSETVFERCADRLYALALRITGAPDDAAAALEDVLRVIAASNGARGDASTVAAALYRGVARAAYRRLRERRRNFHAIAVDDVMPALDDDGQHFEPMDDWSARVGENAGDGTRQEALSAVIDELPPDDRTSLILHDVEAVSTSDIAEILGIDVSAVKLHVHRARLFVRKRLAAYFRALGDAA